MMTTPPLAAPANGMFGHADEIDDTHPPSLTHPGTSVVPAAFAVGSRSSFRHQSEFSEFPVKSAFQAAAQFSEFDRGARRRGVPSTHPTQWADALSEPGVI